MLLPLRASCGAWVLMACGAAWAQQNAVFQAPLFNGRDLDGWQVTGCEAVVENGLLLLKSGDGFVRTDERHGDFVLELDWRARRTSNYDSGIYIRADLSAALGDEGLIVAAQRCVSIDDLSRHVTAKHQILDVNGWPELCGLAARYEGFCW